VAGRLALPILARLVPAAALLALSSVAPAQQAPAQARPAAPAPVIDLLTVSKLVWSSVAALDHANQTGNYSVLRDLGAPSFQSSNSAATLAGIFTAVRTHQIDLSTALVVSPNYDFPPALLPNGLLRARGRFPLRPSAIAFDLLFENVGGQWRIFGMAVAPVVPEPQPAAPRR
jgi:hypothetical protein